MKNSDILTAACFISGMAFGFVVGYCVIGKKLWKKRHKELNDIFNSEVKCDKEESYAEVEVEEKEEPHTYVDAADKESPKEDDTEDEEEVDPNYFAGYQDSEEHKQKRKLPPKLIKQDEYGEDPKYEPVELYFYVGDGVLANEDEEIYEDHNYYVGDCLTRLGFDKNDESVIFVRNYSLGVDYQIKKVWSAYKYACGR